MLVDIGTARQGFIRILAVQAISVAVLLATSVLGYSQNFRVQKIMVCANEIKSIESPCTEVRAPFENLDRNKLSKGRIYLKVWIVCEKDAVDFIEDNDGVLPVRIAVWKNSVRRKTDTQAGMTQGLWEQDGEALKEQFNELGSFPWRTHFYVDVRKLRTLSIEINDAYGKVSRMGGEPVRMSFSFLN